MTVKDYLYALAVGIVVALALIATAAKAGCL